MRQVIRLPPANLVIRGTDSAKLMQRFSPAIEDNGTISKQKVLEIPGLQVFLASIEKDPAVRFFNVVRYNQRAMFGCTGSRPACV